MISVSENFMLAASAGVRKPRARVKIYWTEPSTDVSIEASAPGQTNYICWPEQVADLKTDVARKWFNLDGRYPLSTVMYPAPNSSNKINYQMGWWGNELSNASNGFTVPQVLTLTFTARPIITLLVSGDSQYGEYPVDFVITLYDETTLLTTVSVTGNTLPNWVYDVSADDLVSVTSMVLSITKWSVPYRVVKISEFYTSISTTYDGDEIVSLNVLEEMEIKDGSLPVGNMSANEIDLSLNNIDDKFFPGNTKALLHTLVKKNRRIEAELGFQLTDGSIEYVPMGTFWSGDWKTSEKDTVASTTGRDRMELLRKSDFFSGVLYENQTLKYLAEAVLEDAKLIYPDLVYTVDSALADFVIPYGWFKKQSHFAALNTIVTACLGRAYCDRLGVVKILGPVIATPSVDEITGQNYFDIEQPANTEEIANVISVKTQPLQPSTVVDENVYTSSEDLSMVSCDTETFTCEYKEAPIINASIEEIDVSMEGAGTFTVISSTWYAWGADIKVYCTVSGLFKIKIKGTKFVVADSAVIIKRDTETFNNSIREFGEQRYEFKDNPFVQTAAVANSIANTLLDSFRLTRKDANLNWRGNPAFELVDVLTLPEYVKNGVDNKSDFYITKQQFEFDGGLKATLSGRKFTGEIPDALEWENSSTGEELENGSTDRIYQEV
jgi:hypothetical protein